MRKLLLCSLILLLVLAFATTAFALPAEYGPIEVLLSQGGAAVKTTVYPAYLSCDGKLVAADVPAMLYGGTTMVPLRFVGDLLGAEIGWDQTKNEASFTKGDIHILLTIGSAAAMVNGQEKPLPGGVSVALATYQGNARTMVPLRFVSEELGAKVEWNNTDKTVFLTLPQVPPKNEGTDPVAPEETVDPAVPVPGEPEKPSVGQWKEWIADGKVRIVLDAGHGGADSGASYSSTREKDINLAVAEKVQGLLTGKGYEVIMTRADDTFLPLSDRPQIATDHKATLFLSIHSNSAEAVSASGIETYYAKKNAEVDMSKSLAECVQNAVIAATGTKSRGVKDANYVVLRESIAPAVLVETGFMSNSSELAKLTDSSYQDLLAQGICQGVVDFLAGLK